MENNYAANEFDADASLAQIDGKSFASKIIFHGNIFILIFMVIGGSIYYNISVPVFKEINIILSPSNYKMNKPQKILFLAEMSSNTAFLVKNKNARRIYIRNTEDNIEVSVKIDSLVDIQNKELIGLYLSPRVSNNNGLFSQNVVQHLNYILLFETKRISLIERFLFSR